MRCVDVNVLVYAHRPDCSAHEAYRMWFSADRGFARFPGLRWRHPLEPAV